MYRTVSPTYGVQLSSRNEFQVPMARKLLEAVLACMATCCVGTDSRDQSMDAVS